MIRQEMQRPYHVIVSLGCSCSPALQLIRHKLRRFSAPLDWIVSPRLSDVNRLLSNRFAGYMELPHMQMEQETDLLLEEGTVVLPKTGIAQPVRSYFVKDTLYNILSVHDFPILPDQPWQATYPAFKAKLTHRIERFMNYIGNSPSVLFVRWAGDYAEAYELQSVLSGIVRGSYGVLLLRPEAGAAEITELPWGLRNVCALEVPDDPNDNDIWDYAFEGISISVI